MLAVTRPRVVCSTVTLAPRAVRAQYTELWGAPVQAGVLVGS